VAPGDFVVIEQSSPTGSILGSNNGLRGFKHGARGYVVANGAVRDTDELILQKVPVWCQGISQEMVQARIRFDTQDVPVTVGGVTVNPGDMVVADGDGVIVVPREAALDVARYARRELVSDKASRKQLYQDIGLPLDDTVR
jgi:regulator of RNase E activity RraA